MKNPGLFKNGKEFIESMEELIERYKKALDLGISKNVYEQKNDLSCLLCNPIRIKENLEYYVDNLSQFYDPHKSACKELGCPWIVILGMTCDDFSRLNNSGWAIYKDQDQDVIKRRIKQLRNWIKIYKIHMEGNCA